MFSDNYFWNTIDCSFLKQVSQEDVWVFVDSRKMRFFVILNEKAIINFSMNIIKHFPVIINSNCANCIKVQFNTYINE